MKRLIIVLALLLTASGPAFGQAQTLAMAKAVTACGGRSLTNGGTYPVAQDLTGTLCTGSGGGGGGAVTIADGADVAEGATADAAATAGGTGTVSAKLRLITSLLNTIASSPIISGGLSVYFVQPAASDNHANIKNGAGLVYKISATNNSNTVNYLRLYNAATGFNGCNSATNLIYQMAVPASTLGAGYSDSWEAGIAFSTGISICVTSGYATNDTTNATASAMSINVGYK